MQYLEELMSTRLGVKRNGEVVEADQRVGPDGKEYYDIQVLIMVCQLSKPVDGDGCKSVQSVTWSSTI